MCLDVENTGNIRNIQSDLIRNLFKEVILNGYGLINQLKNVVLKVNNKDEFDGMLPTFYEVTFTCHF